MTLGLLIMRVHSQQADS